MKANQANSVAKRANTADYDSPRILVIQEGRILKVALKSLKIAYG